LVDDLHLADSSVTDIVADLRQHPLPAPVLLIATARSGELDLAADILLGPLDDAEIQQLLAAVLGGPAPPEVQAVIQSRVGGHPLMAAQSASYLLESQALAVKDGVVTVVVPEALERLPASLRLSVAARIDQLPAREKAVVQELSTLGDVFDDGWVSNVLGSRSVAMLEPIAARGLIDRSGNSWRFAHGVIQEVAYSSLTRRTRGELHRRQLALLPAEALLELRGYHAVAWAESVAEVNRDELAAAVDAALAETLRLAKVRYTTEARGTHSAIKRIRPLIDDRLAANTTAVELLLLDAQCLIELGEFDEALQVTRRVEGVGREVIGPQLWLRLALTKGHALSRLRRFQSARQVLDDAVGVAESQADLSARAQAVLLMAETWRHSVFRRYISLTEDAYHLFVQAGDTAGAGECARILAYLFSPGAPVAYDRWSRAARDATADHDIRGQAWIARSNAIAYEARREFASSLAEARRAVELGELTGAADIVADGLNVSVDCHYALAEPVAAVAPAERLIEMAESQANPRMRLIAAAAASGALLRAGEIDRALEELQLAIDRVGNFGPAEEYTVAVARAVIARDRGEWESSYQAFLETDRAVQASGSVLFQLVARAEVARSGLMCDENKWADSLDGAIADSRELGTGLITSYLEAVADLARVLAGEQVELSSATAGATTEELAIRSDTAALRTELVGGDARGLWAESAALWRPVGYTVWLARAAARAGDRTAAEAVLDLLRVSPEARDWALGR
jgi:tetratricopeptide (TPR) repeat protein